MPNIVLRLPFTRVLKLDPGKVAGFRRYAHVLDYLRVTLPDHRASTPEYLAVETGEAGTLSVRLAVQGKAYEGFLREWSGQPADRVSEVMERDMRARQSLSPDYPADAVIDDGRVAQEAARVDFEANAVVVGGRVYGRDPVPQVCLVLGGDGVRVRTMRAGEPRPESWMRFPLDRRDDALAMASTLATSLASFGPAPAGRTGRPPDTMEFVSWSVKDRDALASLPLSEGGHGGRFERVWDFADDFMRLVMPSVGYFPNEVLTAFVETRVQVRMGNDADEALESLARGILDLPPAPEIGPQALAGLRIAARCLLVRMEDHEPRYGIAPGP